MCQHPILARTSPYSMHPEYEGSAEVNFNTIMDIPDCYQSDIGSRMLYPMPPPFFFPFVNTTQDLHFTPMTVYDAAGEFVDPFDFPQSLAGVIAQIDFQVSSSAYAGMTAKITSITIM